MNTILSREARQGMGDAASGPRHSCFAPSRLRRLSHSVSVAIAVFLASYFLAAFVSAAGAR